MKTVIDPSTPESWRAPLVAAVWLEPASGERPAVSPELMAAAPWLQDTLALQDASAKQGELLMVYGPADHAVPRVLLCGLGKASRFTADEPARLAALRDAMGLMARRCRDAKLQTWAISLPDVRRAMPEEPEGRLVREAVCGALLGLHRQTAWKSVEKRADLVADPEALHIVGANVTLTAEVQKGTIDAQAVCLTRDLVNAPANALTPEALAEQAVQLAAEHASKGMHCMVMGPEEMREQGMGAFLAVAAGSVHEPRLVVLEYAPAGCELAPPLVFVGKGITFDSGGISLKPSAGMERMKGDMAGAASVLGLFSALGSLRPSCRVIGVMACAENMPDARATRPGDVVTTFAGKTVEIINTDAEGRLVLCDAMSYAQKCWHPKVLIDIATLTGACIVALGNDVAGLFSREPVLTERLRSLGALVGDKMWPMPLWDSYFENLKSDTADFANAGAREGGACAAGMFLAQFVHEGTRWAHIDIAGPAQATKGSATAQAGGTGFVVRTLIDFVLEL